MAPRAISLSPVRAAESERPLRGPIRVLILDPHPLMRRGLRALVGAESDMVVCAEGSPGDFSRRRLTRLRPDVALVAASDHDRALVSTIRALRECCPAVSIVALSLYDDPGRMRHVLTAGASEVVLKMADRVLAAIRRTRPGVRGKRASAPPRPLSAPPRRLRRETTDELELDPLDREIVGLVGTGLPSAAISVRLRVPARTVEARLVRLRRKLKIKNPIELVKFCVQWNRRIARPA